MYSIIGLVSNDFIDFQVGPHLFVSDVRIYVGKYERSEIILDIIIELMYT